ncbi:MAG TPA: TlyA family RNA methyltransferase [Candidatus Eremiobacteraceae bacterium]|nr:TlyA family RNA methyltransferase [Candidatus Eremiobacteraceae bacterium]
MKQRLDVLLVARGLAPSREQAQGAIMAGEVFVDGKRVDKAGMLVPDGAELELRGGMPYVSRGGYKLAAALDRFHIDVQAKACADVGASTGGFTDVLLQRGAAKVYAIDVGYGQLDWKLRSDPRVVVMERTNIRSIARLPELLSFVCVDVAFISLRLVLPVVKGLLASPGAGSAEDPAAVALIKPQFEAGKAQVGKGGVVRDPKVHRTVLKTTVQFCAKSGWAVNGLIVSPIKGPAGNIEFLAHLTPVESGPMPISGEELVDVAMAEAGALR